MPPNAPLLPPSVRLFRRLLSPRLKRRTRVCWGWYLKECAAVAHFLCAWRAFVALSTAGWLDTIHCLGANPSPSNNAAEASDAVNTPILIERAPSPKWKFVFTISPAQFAYIRTFKYSRWKSRRAISCTLSSSQIRKTHQGCLLSMSSL